MDGMPSGIDVDIKFIQAQLSRRRPGQSDLTTSRSEEDKVEFLSGIFQGKTTGAPIGFIVRNTDQRPHDYDTMKDLFRPSHADYTYETKYGLRDYRGGGRASARVTIARQVAGALAQLVLRRFGISITAYTSQVGDICAADDYRAFDLTTVDDSPVRCPDKSVAKAMDSLIREVKEAGDSIGGVVSCVVKGCPVGLGEPEAGKLHALLAAAMLSINAAKGFDYGSGFRRASLRGSQTNDPFTMKEGKVATTTNFSGGIQGGISNGEDIYFRVAFKPVATIMQSQATITKDKKPTTFEARGRHDACVLPRAVPLVEAMAAMVILDCLLIQKSRESLTNNQ